MFHEVKSSAISGAADRIGQFKYDWEKPYLEMTRDFILSNVRLDRGEVSVRHEATKIATGLRKFGAIVGDKAEIGCNSVISPGSIIGRGSLIYPLTHFSGVLAENTILQNHQNLRTIPRQALG